MLPSIYNTNAKLILFHLTVRSFFTQYNLRNIDNYQELIILMNFYLESFLSQFYLIIPDDVEFRIIPVGSLLPNASTDS